MEVLLFVGRYAGEIKDIRSDCALQMIADGRALDPRLPIAEVSELSAGGEIPADTTFLVGEQPQGLFVPHAMAQRLKAAAKKRGGRRGE